MPIDSKARVLGSVGVITAYFIILHVNILLGVSIQLIADLISVPYFVRTRAWDVVIMLSFLLVISLSKLTTSWSVHYSGTAPQNRVY